MAEISSEQVKHVADLARLEVTDEEAEKLSKDLSELMQQIDLLQKVDTENVEPTINVASLNNVMRNDEPKELVTQEEVLKNAPDAKDGFFRVPSILE